MGIDVFEFCRDFFWSFLELGFFMVILRARIFFGQLRARIFFWSFKRQDFFRLLNFFKKNRLRSIFRDLTRGAKQSSSHPVWRAKALIFLTSEN
jgi:hypothetical protein